jgi:formylglycine-generating enzyme required for sulfatase activity
VVLGKYGWFGDLFSSQTRPVGHKRPNPWGLFDMHGNVSEWCWDGYDDKYYTRSPVDDPHGPPGAALRVNRGGNWDSISRRCRSADRDKFRPDDWFSLVGFRVARDLVGP